MVNQIEPLLMTSLYQKQDQFKKALCVAVIDESNAASESEMNTKWDAFKSAHPERSFVILQVDRESPFAPEAFPNITAAQSSSGSYLFSGAPITQPLPTNILNDVKSTDRKYAYIPNSAVFYTDSLGGNTIVGSRPLSGTYDYGRPDRIWNENGTYYWFNKRTQSYMNIDSIIGLDTGGKFFGTPRLYSFIQRSYWEMEWSNSWFNIINNFAIDITSNPIGDFNGKIFLFVDDSGSTWDEQLVSNYLRFLYEAEANGYDVYVVTDDSEEYVDVFQTFTGEQKKYDIESDSIGLFVELDRVTHNILLGVTDPSATTNSFNMTPIKYSYLNSTGSTNVLHSPGLWAPQFLEKAPVDQQGQPLPPDILKLRMRNGQGFVFSSHSQEAYKDYPLRLFKKSANPVVAQNIRNDGSGRVEIETQIPHGLISGDLILCYGGDLDTQNHPLRNLAFFVSVSNITNIVLYQAKSSDFYGDNIVAPDSATWVNAGTNGIPLGTLLFFVEKYSPVSTIVDKYVNNTSGSRTNTYNVYKSEYNTQLSELTPGNQYQVGLIPSSQSTFFDTHLNTRHSNVLAGNKYLATNTKNSIMNFSINVT